MYKRQLDGPEILHAGATRIWVVDSDGQGCGGTTAVTATNGAAQTPVKVRSTLNSVGEIYNGTTDYHSGLLFLHIIRIRPELSILQQVLDDYIDGLNAVRLDVQLIK